VWDVLADIEINKVCVKRLNSHQISGFARLHVPVLYTTRHDTASERASQQASSDSVNEKIITGGLRAGIDKEREELRKGSVGTAHDSPAD